MYTSFFRCMIGFKFLNCFYIEAGLLSKASVENFFEFVQYKVLIWKHLMLILCDYGKLVNC